jgi:hypothetical protein
MKRSWITVAALSLALTAGCSDRGDNNSQNAPSADPNAPAANAPAANPPADNRASEGQGEPSSTDSAAQVESPVRARLRQSITVNGITALPAGAILTGEVTDVARAGKVKGRSRIAFTFNRLQADELNEDVSTNPLLFEGEQSKGEDATKIGAGAVGGAIVGGILGGGGGAAKGAAIGGAAGTGVVLATRGKDVTLANGADLAASLAAPLTIRVPVR